MQDVAVCQLIDRLDSEISEGEFAGAVSTMLGLGEPALLALVEVLNGSVAASTGHDPIETYNRRIVALAVLSSRQPDLVLELIQGGRMALGFGVVQALGSSDDLRLTSIARDALQSGETFGR